MSDFLDVKVIIDRKWTKPTVYIKCAQQDEGIEGLISVIQTFANKKIPMIPVYFRESLVMLPQRHIQRLYICDRKLMIQTSERTYETRKPLKELENILDPERFVRISQSETINIKMVKSFDFSISGTIGVELLNGEKTFVARRRVKEVKDVLVRVEQELR